MFWLVAIEWIEAVFTLAIKSLGCRQYPPEQFLGRRRAAGDFDVDRDDVFHHAATGVADAELSAVTGAFACGDHQSRGGIASRVRLSAASMCLETGR